MRTSATARPFTDIVKCGRIATGDYRAFTLSDAATLPKNFSWLKRTKIAGSARPETEAELKAVKQEGISAIVSLTGAPLSPDVVNRFGFEYLHSHVSGAPTVAQMHQIIQFIEQQNARSNPVLVHCGEGKGRTGTILASYLASHGLNADEAIRIVREKRPGSIQSAEQETLIHEFQKSLRPNRK